MANLTLFKKKKKEKLTKPKPFGLYNNKKLCVVFFLQVRNVFCMKAKEGRKKSIRALVVVGNGKGAAGMCIYCMYKVTSDWDNLWELE